MLKPGRFLVRLAAFSGFATGCLMILAGLATAILVPASSGSLARGAEGLAEGIGGAEDAVRILGRDFEQSSSLFGTVSSSIRETGLIARDTRLSLGQARGAASELVTACTLTAGDLEAISSRLGAVTGPTSLRTAAGHLREAATSGAMAITSMDTLEARLGTMESLLVSVAASVDTLGSDLGSARTTMEDAGTRLASVRNLAEGSASSAAIAITGMLAGLAMIVLGLQQIVLSTLLLSHQPDRAIATSPLREEALPPD